MSNVLSASVALRYAVWWKVDNCPEAPGAMCPWQCDRDRQWRNCVYNDLLLASNHLEGCACFGSESLIPGVPENRDPRFAAARRSTSADVISTVYPDA